MLLMLCYVIDVMLCYAMLLMLCYVMLCYVIDVNVIKRLPVYQNYILSLFFSFLTLQLTVSCAPKLDMDHIVAAGGTCMCFRFDLVSCVS